jgi:hypothetical protein
MTMNICFEIYLCGDESLANSQFKLLVYLKEAKALMPHVPHEDGVRMRFHREIAIRVLPNESAHFLCLCTEEFKSLIDLADKSFHILKRVAIGKEWVTLIGFFEVDLLSYFLLSNIAVQ